VGPRTVLETLDNSKGQTHLETWMMFRKLKTERTYEEVWREEE
jgi:hypothetical protein